MIEFRSYYSGSRANLYTASDGHTTLLIECGVRIKAIHEALGFGLGMASACLLSHAHADHSLSAYDIMRSGVDLYCHRETALAMELSGHRLHLIEPLVQFKIGAWRVLPFSTEHDCPGSLGFLLANGSEKLLFATDTYFIRHRFRGLTIIAVECNYSLATLDPDLEPYRKKRLLESHFSLEHVLKFLAANDLSQVREIHLLHMSDDNGDAEYFKQAVQKATGKPVYVAQERPE